MSPLLSGWVLVLLVYVGSLFLHVVLPARTVTGYCCDNATFQPLRYRLNGAAVLVVVAALFVTALPSPAQASLHEDMVPALFFANAVGLSLSLFFFLRGGREKYARCVTVDQLKDPSALRLAGPPPSAAATFFLGREWNPRVGAVDIKMFLYVVGAVLLQCNLFAAVRFQQGRQSDVSIAMSVYVSCFTFFLVEYMCGEAVHLYTYDLFAEKIGFKLVWGCLVFYPFFYPIGSIPLARATRDISPATAIAITALYFAGWVVTRGANLQKYFFRTNPASTACFGGLVVQRVVPGTRLLVSGFWGAARHLNYFGEIVQAIAMALPGTLVADSWTDAMLPWLYPLYYVVLFVTRQIDDDAVCALKYGAMWDEYCKQVPSRIVPGLY
ncbi:Aste57867_21906 [Aphanomyces stellatus]|uniref:Aste57867_21906 protein n=1 Tax=Aphanomyces stellatus TaxID=120398 RepID=A0A485LNM8_9STRA|nr:hypothetical protein As57867_021837 [Aphanomyces stellatus]VFT98574.1 Aste57867_21906 [Aphanomyces stellatus]